MLQTTLNIIHLPQIFNLSNSQQQSEFNLLLEKNPHLFIFDEIRSQVGELIKSQNPQTIYKGNMLDEAVDAFFTDKDAHQYGLWVYYPWNASLVHLLPKNEFIEVRTNRNRNKITNEDRDILATKKIGVIGLSVGQSVATTLALERLCGEIRIADFDILELSNYNRIRTSLRNMGLNKSISVAREIAEIDPFIDVVIYPQGITTDNIESFLTEGGKLDLLIEESDGLEIKIRAREEAKKHGIPVLMEASERGVVDVERFDREPNRPILHGLLEGMDLEAAKLAVTNEEKMPFMMQIVGMDIISDTMKSSMLEIGQSLTTWPQLASAVVYGGGMTADVARRLLLNEFTASGRYVVDMSSIINNNTEVYTPKGYTFVPPSTKGRDFAALVKSYAGKGEYEVEKSILTAILESACKSPSGGNSQPWKWIYRNNILYLFHEIDISTQWLDYRHRGAHISFGAALESLSLEAYHHGLDAVIDLNTDEESLLIATIIFKPLSTETKEQKAAWYATFYPHLNKRLSNRYLGNMQPIEPAHINLLKEIASTTPGAVLNVVTDRNQLQQLASVVGISERLLLTNKTSHTEFYNEIKWTKEEAETTRVGIDIRTVELSATEMAGFHMARNWNVVNNLLKWGGGGAFEKLGNKMTKSSSALALLTMPTYTKKDFITAGRVLQQVWIKANELGISVQPMSAAIFLFARLLHGNGEGLSDKMIQELQQIRKVHNQLFNTNDSKGEIFLFRLFYAGEPKVTSLRKPLADVFEII